MIDNKFLGFEDVPLDNHSHLSKDIIRVVDGTMMVSISGMIIRT